MSKALFACLAVSTFLTPVSAFAAAIDQAGADQLRATFERYIGAAPAGQTPYVTVTPDGAAYKVTIDSHGLMAAMADALKAPLNADAAPISFHTAPVEGGKWRVYDFAPIKGSFAFKDQSGSFEMGSIDFDGIYDPALAAFASSTMTVPLITIDQQAPEMTATAKTHDMRYTTIGTAGHDATTDLTAESKVGAYEQIINMVPPGSDAKQASKSFTVKITADSRDLQFGIKGLHARELSDIWAMIVAHSTREERAAHKEEFKAAALKFLPGLDTLSVAGNFNGVTIKTPVGQGGFATGGVKLDFSMAPAANSLSFRETFDDLSIDSVLLPPGVQPLLPTKISIGAEVKNFDLNAMMHKVIELDPDKNPDPAVKAANDEAIQKALVPSGSVVIALPPSAIAGKDYTVGWQGEISAEIGKTPHAKIHLDVKATGVDALAKQVGQLKVPHAPEAMIGIYAAQALGQKQSDGSLTWAIDFSDHGDFLVNGKAIGKK